MKKFTVFDIDGTLIRWQLYHAIADTMVKLGFIDERSYSTIRKARMDWKKRSTSFKDYEIQLVQAYNRALKRLSFDQFKQASDAVFEEYKDQSYTYTRDLIAKLKKRHYLIFAISGSQSEIVEKVALHYGFDDFLGTEYERQGPKFSGKFVFHAAKKDEAIKNLAKRNNAGFGGSLAVGDSASDIPMLELVETPIAFNPERELFEYAKVRGWKIVVERKNMIYELEFQNGQYELVKAN